MTAFEDALRAAVLAAGPKPADTAPAPTKKNWNEKLSNTLAPAIAAELRKRGMKETRPAPPATPGGPSGTERRLAGGIGAKKVDVSWATEESGLILACSVKTIMFRDQKTNAYQKNVTNRRGDLLIEAVTLHRRFPYAVVAGFLFLDIGAETDHTTRRKSTFENIFPRFRLFTGRNDPSDRDEQFERLFIVLTDTSPHQPDLRFYEVNDPTKQWSPDDIIDELCELIGERNFDMYDGTGGRITKA